MLAGNRPFSGDSSVSVALAHISQAPEPLSTSISAPTRELIGLALRKDPNTRFADGNEFTNAISAVRQGQRPPQPKSAALAPLAAEPSPSASTEMLGNMAHPTTVRPATQPPTAEPPTKKGGFGTGLLIAVAIAALVGIGLAGYKFFTENSSEPAPTTTEQPTEIIVTETVTPETTEEPTTEASTTLNTVETTTVEEEPPAPVTVTTTHSVLPPPTQEVSPQQPTDEELLPEETQPQVNDGPTATAELESQGNPTEESALQGGQ